MGKTLKYVKEFDFSSAGKTVGLRTNQFANGLQIDVEDGGLGPGIAVQDFIGLSQGRFAAYLGAVVISQLAITGADTLNKGHGGGGLRRKKV